MLAVTDSGDNSLCLPAPRSDSFAGSAAPLKTTTWFRTQSITTLLPPAPIFITRCDRHGHGRLLSFHWTVRSKSPAAPYYLIQPGGLLRRGSPSCTCHISRIPVYFCTRARKAGMSGLPLRSRSTSRVDGSCMATDFGEQRGIQRTPVQRREARLPGSVRDPGRRSADDQAVDRTAFE